MVSPTTELIDTAAAAKASQGAFGSTAVAHAFSSAALDNRSVSFAMAMTASISRGEPTATKAGIVSLSDTIWSSKYGRDSFR